jgi:hypothetical protein
VTGSSRVGKALRIGLGVLSVVALSGCGSSDGFPFRNDCGFDVEAMNLFPDSDASHDQTLIPIDDTVDVPIDFPAFGVWVFPADKPHLGNWISWEEIEEQTPGDADVFVLSGAYCPNSSVPWPEDPPRPEDPPEVES